ncbi:MAG: tyrosinase family protein [Roseiflexaceae bacterium]
MSESSGPKVRYSIQYLQEQYDKGNKKPLEDLVRAWKGIQELPATDKRSLFALGGYHGEPFQYRRAVDELSDVDRYAYWGGYCNHGNVLFPTWHRVYVYKLELALQSIVPDVTMAYWDETDQYTLNNGIPSVLTQEQFELDGELIPNPLRSFTLPEALTDYLPGDERFWAKPKGYQTVRYPLSGLVGTPKWTVITKEHNAKYPDPATNTKLLNDNILAWLHGLHPTPENPNPKGPGIYWLFENCLNAPNYTVFSNTTSAGQWNKERRGDVVTALESPHNDIHLAVGGFYLPQQNAEYGQVAGANGDMGENNTASMDPIFYFHHCNIDRMFWLWQKRHGATDKLDIISGYAGTNSSDSQGPTPGIAPGTSLGLDTPLNPFLKDEFGTVFTSNDCINIETQLGYTYAPGSFDEPEAKLSAGFQASKKLLASGIDRALFQGSFVLVAYATETDASGNETKHYLGHYSVLSRWNVIGCANCLTHLEVVAHFPLPATLTATEKEFNYHLEVQSRELDVVRPNRLMLNAVRRIDNTSEPTTAPARWNYKLEVVD